MLKFEIFLSKVIGHVCPVGKWIGLGWDVGKKELPWKRKNNDFIFLLISLMNFKIPLNLFVIVLKGYFSKLLIITSKELQNK